MGIFHEYETLLDKNKHIYLKEVRDFYLDKEEEHFYDSTEIRNFMVKEYKMDQLAEEHLFVIAMNIASKPLGVFEISHGTATSTILTNREIFTKLCLLGATNFVMIHNHPSGECKPSKGDIEVTEYVKKGSEIMEIHLVDHIIIGDDHYSFAKHNYF